MERRKGLIRIVCWLIMATLLLNASCISSSKGLGIYEERKVGERRVNREETLGDPIIEITRKPTPAEPDISVKIMAEMIKRDSIIERYEKMEKTKQTTSGTGLLVVGGITMVVGMFQWLFNTLSANETTKNGRTLTDEEKDDNKDKYGPKASKGLTLLLLGVIPLIAGASIDRKTMTTYKKVDEFEKEVTRDIGLGKKVPLQKLVVNASVKNDRFTFNTSSSTDQNGEATLKIDNILAQSISTAKEIPSNITVNLEVKGQRANSLPLSIQEAVALMSHGQVDWSTEPEGLTPYPQAQLKIIGSAKSGETIGLNLTVSNKRGKGACYRLEAMVQSDQALFNRRILIGRIEVGAEVTGQIQVEIPRLWSDRVIPLTISFNELYSNIPDSLEAKLAIEGLPRPFLAYSYEIIDDSTGNSVGNGDGRAQKGEALDIEITVNNTGAALARNTKAKISFVSAPGVGVKIQRDQLSFGDLQPNESKKGRFTIAIKKIAQVDNIQLRLDITEQNMKVFTVDNINIKIGAQTTSKAIVMNPKPAYVTVDEITVRGGASADSIERFRLKKDSPMSVIGQIGDWYKVDLGGERYGWVSKNEMVFTPPKGTTATATPSVPTVIEVLQKAPPLIVMAQPSKKRLETTDASIKIVGTAGDDRSVEKLDIVVNGTVLETLNTRGISVVPTGQPREKIPTYSFEQEIALAMGPNEIKIIAYDDENLTRTYVIQVNRIVPRGETHLLVISIGNYNDAGIKKLLYAENDARAVLEFFQKDARSPIKPGNIIFLSGKQATSRNIRKAISELARKTKKHDTVIFYYAGHGDVGKHPTKGTEYYLIPVDAEKDDLFSTALELSAVQRLWSAVISKRKIFIADACNSGGFIGIRGDVDGFEQGMGEGTVVMTASSRGQKALEVPQLKHGLFTYYLLEGLRGKADQNNDNRISVTEMKKYLDENVPAKAKQLGSVQTPVIKIESIGEIYLSK